jgi:hypothetical protein
LQPGIGHTGGLVLNLIKSKREFTVLEAVLQSLTCHWSGERETQ